MERIGDFLRPKVRQFAQIVYSRETGEVLGRTWKSWSQIITFFLVFYCMIGALFAAHLAIFIHITPEAAEDVKPWNFGRYAYPNYPNAKIALIPLPKRITFKDNKAVLSDKDRNAIRRLMISANQSGVSDHCLDGATLYGYAEGEPCIFIRVQRVLEWIPELVNESLSDATVLPISCEVESSFTNLQVNISTQPAGIPLDLNNNKDSRSFPYRHQSNYLSPIMGVMVNLTSASGLPTSDKFVVTIACSVDYSGLGWSRPSDTELKRLYETPDETSTVVRFIM